MDGWILGVPLCPEHNAAIRAECRVEVPVPLFTSVVYYVCWRDRDEVKIGVSQNVEHRIRAFNKAGGRRAILMATEPGGYALEKKRHSQFASLRVPGTELFRYAPVLADHIDSIRRA